MTQERHWVSFAPISSKIGDIIGQAQVSKRQYINYLRRYRQMKKTYYLLGVEGGVEPTVYGPYATIDDQGNAAKEIHREQEDDDSLFWAEVDEAGVLTVGSYTAGVFWEDSEEDIH